MARVRFPTGTSFFSLLHSSQISSEAHPASYPVCFGGYFPKSKQPWHEADHSPPSNTEVKNGGAVPLLPNMSTWHGTQLIKHRDSFTV
jgi:hypothetical protein